MSGNQREAWQIGSALVQLIDGRIVSSLFESIERGPSIPDTRRERLRQDAPRLAASVPGPRLAENQA